MICVSSASYSKMYKHVKNSDEHKWDVDALALSHKHRFSETGVLDIQPGRRPGGLKRPPPEPEEPRPCAGVLSRERKKAKVETVKDCSLLFDVGVSIDEEEALGLPDLLKKTTP